MTRDRDVGPLAAAAAVVVACAACCAGPLLAFLAATGVTSAIASFRLPLLAVLSIVSFGGVWWLRRRSRARCAAPADVVDLPMPGVRPASDAVVLDARHQDGAPTPRG